MIKSQALSGKSNKVLIFLGLFLGLVSAVLVVVYLKSAGGESSGDVSGGVLTPVVVAKSDIPAGTAITEDNWQQMVEVKEFTSDVVLLGAYSDTGDVVGQVTRVPLVAGEQVIPTKVTATGAAIADGESPPLAYVVPEGKRAVAIQVSSVIGASGLIRAGDYVDVILSVKIGGSGAAEGSDSVSLESDQIARTVLQNAQVLSIDQDVALTAVDEGAEGAPAVGEDSEANPEAISVTLAVLPAHGEVLTAAEVCGENNSGRLALALRRFGDGSAIETRSVWAQGGPAPTCAALLGLSTAQ